jgi:hypothetical protein
MRKINGEGLLRSDFRGKQWFKSLRGGVEGFKGLMCIITRSEGCAAHRATSGQNAKLLLYILTPQLGG